ncbi:peptidoglycan/LPS O-acetylase OafA/YrhL [Streptomyces sp. 1114.5]|uniref:acyltransferase family protein n=1 Tax=Streptomyces sp. 1114.5 TaxID=1938830 RepID=UPI000F2B4582|nr:acyltransferase [Streptomyces sp. 1114.5]RKT08691.1 peptidoglycan/LPS O-acetylase OafA/YrhL [Streptomyces sp. 1114.5]
MRAHRDTARPGGRLPTLTALRFAAALAVFLFHVFLTTDPLYPQAPLTLFADPRTASVLACVTSKAGYAGVSFFFVLSGFVLTWSARGPEPPGVFWRRRLARIYPTHLVLWVAALLLFARAGPVRVWLPNLLLVHANSPDANVNSGMNMPSWSLCCELLFYLLFPLLYRVLRRLPERGVLPAAGVCLLTAAVVALVDAVLLPGRPRIPQLPVSLDQLWFGYLFPPARLPEFVLGMLLARAVAAGVAPRLGLAPAALLLLPAYALTLVVPSPFDFTLPMVVPLALVICAAAHRDLHRPCPAHPLGQWLGKVSFGFYLCQGVVLFHGRPLLLGERTFAAPAAAALTLAAFAVTLGAGALTYTAVERPAVGWLARAGTPARGSGREWAG